MKRIIYCLLEDGIPFYIGKTKNPYSREHVHKIKYPNSTFEILDEVPTEDWKFWERHYISLYRSWGFKLHNKKLHAGNGCDIVSDETRKKMSKAQEGNKKGVGKTYMLGKKLSDETKKKISQSNKGREGHWKGKKLSNETKQKMSKASQHISFWKGRKLSDETKKKMSEAKIGKKIIGRKSSPRGPQSEETKKKISEALKRKK